MQKLNCILKICFNNDEPNPGPKKQQQKNKKTKKRLHTIETKWGIRICCQTRIFALCSDTENVREGNQCLTNTSKFFWYILGHGNRQLLTLS